jgi:hypothetical protein
VSVDDAEEEAEVIVDCVCALSAEVEEAELVVWICADVKVASDAADVLMAEVEAAVVDDVETEVISTSFGTIQKESAMSFVGVRMNSKSTDPFSKEVKRPYPYQAPRRRDQVGCGCWKVFRNGAPPVPVL